MKVQEVTSENFKKYGTIIDGYELSPIVETLVAKTPRPEKGVVYVPSCDDLENVSVTKELAKNFYGGMPVEFGYCNGHNKTLNCLEYHRGSEINIPSQDVILLLAEKKKMVGNTLDTKEVEAFHVPSGTAVQIYSTTLHYAPCTWKDEDGFRVVIVLAKGTNDGSVHITAHNAEDTLLWATNKWLIAHKESPEAKDGAFVGLIGENLTV